MLKFIFSLTFFSTTLFAQNNFFKTNMTITVFNMQKSENRNWDNAIFNSLVNDSDLVLIQESVDQFSDSSHIHYFYKSWGKRLWSTGLSTLTTVPFDESKKLISKDREPIFSTPKTTSIEKYSIKGISKKLLVANTHGINFTGLSSFKRQMSAVAKELTLHDGPMIWVGDFNTWSSGRKNFLNSIMQDLNLEEVEFTNRSEVFLVLDHAYTRGMKVIEAKQLQLGISDHEPLQFSVEFIKEPGS